MKYNKYLVWILCVAFVSRLIVFLIPSDPLWDSAIYIGMAKYFYSLGNIGINEAIRPPLYALIIGLFWFFKLEILVFAKILNVVIGVVNVYLVYLIGRKLFDNNVGLVAGLILSLTSSIIFFDARILAGTFAIFFSLWGFYNFIKENFFLAGLFVGLSFLTRFPTAIFIILLCIGSLFLEKNLKERIMSLFKASIGFLVIALPYLFYNKLAFGGYLEPFLAASSIKKLVGTRISMSGFYYIQRLLSENVLLIFYIIGVYLLFRSHEKDPKKWMVAIAGLLILIYYNSVAHKEIRYMYTALPFLIIITAYGFNMYIHKLQLKIAPFIALLLLSAMIAVPIYSLDFDRTRDLDELYSLADGKIAASDPFVVAYADVKLTIFYWMYPEVYSKYFVKEPNDMVLIDVCEIECIKYDEGCNKTKDELVRLFGMHQVLYNQTIDGCEYYLFKLRSPFI